MSDAYRAFLEAKAPLASQHGVPVDDDELSPILKPHQRAIVRWAVSGGRRGIFAAFGLGKTMMQIETLRLILKRTGGRGLIVAPLGVRQEFIRDAAMLGVEIRFIRRIEEAEDTGLYLTNYETVRDGKLDPRHFKAASLDEASCLRGFGGTKTFREFMAIFAGDDRSGAGRASVVPYRFVATATPSPNAYIELLAYAAYLGVMEVGEAKTRFFRRNSEKADELTLHPHKEREFWLWVASWGLFVERPSDLGYDDTGYDLPPLDVRWHEVASDHSQAGEDRDGQGRMFRNAAVGVVDAAREKRDSLAARIEKLMALRDEDPGAHRVIWHDLEAERHAIKKAIPEAEPVYGSQDLDEREKVIIDFSEGRIQELAAKPSIAGSGTNLQRHCAWEIFLGIGFKFNDLIQAIHRCYRFLQTRPVRVDLIYTEAEREIRRTLEGKWTRHNEQREIMRALIREYGLADAAKADALKRSIEVERRERSGAAWRMVNNDAIEECRAMPAASVDLIVTSIPFATQYEYTPSYRDFGHTDDNPHFWRQMDFLTPELLRVLQPGRVACIHVKDRIVPGGVSGLGFQTVQPFSDECIAHFRSHGFAFLARKTIVTDVVRENNQTYRLGWTEQCKDGSRMGAGMPEYLLIFRKPPSDLSNGYADNPVVKGKPLCDDHGRPEPFDKRTNWRHPVPGTGYTRARWQLDAHGFTRSSGDRLLSSQELARLPHKQLYRLWRDRSTNGVYDFAGHLGVTEELDHAERLPSSFMLLPPHSWHPDVWSDVARMRTLNMLQQRAGREMHLCLARGSRVLTRERGYVPIEDVSVGEHALTHLGRWRPVEVVANTGVQPVIMLRAQGMPGLTLTPDHKLWVRQSDWVRERDGAARAEPAWVEAQAALGGYVNLKLPPVDDADVPGDELTWWIIGRWLADGHFDARGGIHISCGEHEVDNLLGRLGGHAGFVGRAGTAPQVRVRTRGTPLRSILDGCGFGAAGKHLPPEAYSLGVERSEALLSGYLSGDGHFLPDRRRWTASSVSRDLLLGIAMLAQRVHGSVATVYAGRAARAAEIEGRTVACKPDWTLSFDLPGDRRKQPFVLEDGAWKKVRELADAGEAETWCLRVAEDESFTAEGCIVKNCPLQFDIVDRAIIQFSMEGETVLDPFAGIGTVPYCAVKLGRRAIGIELNGTEYWPDAVTYCEIAEREIALPTMFDLLDIEAEADADVPAEAAE